MAEAGTNNEALLSNPVPSPLIDRDEPAEKKVTPAPAAEAKKADIPAATDENAIPKEQDEAKQSRRQRKLQIERDARIRAETRAELAEKALAARDQPAAKEASEPKRDDFQDYESFLDARTEWRTKQGVETALKAEREERSKREQEGKTRAGQEALAKDWTQREAEFQKKVPTYVDDVTDFVEGELQQLSDQARHAIVELGPEVLHHLSSNDELMDELLKLSPLRQVARLGRIDLTAKDTGAEAPAEAEVDEEPAPKRREPPAPAKHVRHGVTTPAALSDDMDVYVQQRRKQGARWAR